MNQYELLKEVRDLYLKLKREFILDADIQAKLQEIPYKGVELYLTAIRIILEEGKTKGELILRDGKRLAKEQKKFYKKKLREYERLFNSLPKSKKKETSWVHHKPEHNEVVKQDNQKIEIERTTIDEFLEKYDKNRSVVYLKRVFKIKWFFIIPFLSIERKFFLSKELFKKFSIMVDYLIFVSEIVSYIKKQLLRDPSVYEPTIYNFCYVVDDIFFKFFRFYEALKKYKLELNSAIKDVFLDFYKTYLAYKEIDFSFYVIEVAEYGRLYGKFSTEKELTRFYLGFATLFHLDIEKVAFLLELEKIGIHQHDNSFYFALLYSVLDDKTTIKEDTIRILLAVFTKEIDKENWYGSEELLKKYKKDKESIQKMKEALALSNLYKHIDKVLEYKINGIGVLEFLSKEYIKNLPKSFYENYVFRLSMFLEAFIDRYKDIVIGKPISLYVGDEDYYLSVFPKQKFMLYVDSVDKLHKDVYNAIVEKGGTGFTEEELQSIIKDDNNDIGNNIIKLYEILGSLLQSILQLIAIYESGEFSINYAYFFSVWKYRVKDSRFKDYVVYDDECESKSLICEIIAVIVNILFYMKRIGVYVGGFFDDYYAKKG